MNVQINTVALNKLNLIKGNPLVTLLGFDKNGVLDNQVFIVDYIFSVVGIIKKSYFNRCNKFF